MYSLVIILGLLLDPTTKQYHIQQIVSPAVPKQVCIKAKRDMAKQLPKNAVLVCVPAIVRPSAKEPSPPPVAI